MEEKFKDVTSFDVFFVFFKNLFARHIFRVPPLGESGTLINSPGVGTRLDTVLFSPLLMQKKMMEEVL